MCGLLRPLRDQICIFIGDSVRAADWTWFGRWRTLSPQALYWNRGCSFSRDRLDGNLPVQSILVLILAVALARHLHCLYGRIF